MAREVGSRESGLGSDESREAGENPSPVLAPLSSRFCEEGTPQAADDLEMAAGVIAPWNLTATAKLKIISTSSTVFNPPSTQGRSYIQNIRFFGTSIVSSLGAKICTNKVRWSNIVLATDSSKSSAEPSTSESGNDETASSNDEITPSSNVQLAANGRVPSSSTNLENPVSRRSSLTVREKLRAARVLSKYMESKPTESEFGSKVLEASRQSDKGKKRSGLPEAPTNLFDDSKRGMPQPGWTFELPFQGDIFVIAFSFVFISTVMLGTTYIVWKSGAIHFNEY
ncbi:hypothetical protein Cni_G09374 [Canna indica]|uniref:Uncharacterized protein n=1 Tax=Canna indica TaxID=4628 RepID=A0AAQ3Q8T6_9LILI|nr:hypothetical protein Cni_G09374 [Canna indica]